MEGAGDIEISIDPSGQVHLTVLTQELLEVALALCPDDQNLMRRLELARQLKAEGVTAPACLLPVSCSMPPPMAAQETERIDPPGPSGPCAGETAAMAEMYDAEAADGASAANP